MTDAACHRREHKKCAYFFLLAPTITIILQRHVAIRSIHYLIEEKNIEKQQIAKPLLL